MKKVYIYLPIAALLSASSLNAAIITWDGGGTAAHWSSSQADNWDTNTNPVSGTDSVVITEDGIGQANLNNTVFTVGSGQSITTGGAAPFPVFRLDTAGDLTIGSGGTLDFSGNGQLTNQVSGSLTIDSGATTVETWRYFSQNTGTTKFIADASGVKTFTTGTFFLSGGILEVDLTSYNIGSGATLTLLDYSNNIATSTFDSISVTGIGGGSWTQGVDYTIDYGTAGGAISLTVVPEPSTYALIGGCFALSAVMLRRRQR